jgi:hypothetical protein
LKTPVALIFFNRPQTTARVFAEVARAKPDKLLLIADGPRAGHPSDEENCAATRAIAERVDWDCEVLRNYSDVNLGCKMRPVTGLDWVFDKVEDAIILEDDCLAHPTFFRFCDELLEKYRDDERVMMISGNDFQHGENVTPYSYRFSRYTNTWGWASWRRAWRCFDVQMRAWPPLENTEWLMDVLGSREAAAHWQSVFARTFQASDSVWDYQWLFSCWIQNGLSISPSVNLVSNIGFGEDATHTTGASEIANLPIAEATFPLRHPPWMLRDRAADELIFKLYAQQESTTDSNLSRRIRQKLARAVESPARRLLHSTRPKTR